MQPDGGAGELAFSEFEQVAAEIVGGAVVPVAEGVAAPGSEVGQGGGVVPQGARRGVALGFEEGQELGCGTAGHYGVIETQD